MLGTTSQAADTGWIIAPTYLGAILLMILGFGLFTRIVNVVRQQNIISISDFISSRYGKSQQLAVLVTLVSLIAIVPYISIQLKALTDSFTLLVGAQDLDNNKTLFQPALVTALLMALFAILFGTRRINASEKHEGLILVLSFESILKLFAFIVIGFYSVFIMDLPGASFITAFEQSEVKELLSKNSDSMSFLVQAGLGFVAIFLLPRQFHVAAVENNSVKELKNARWVFPGYLILFNLFILPISIVGITIFGKNSEAMDALILTIPLMTGSASLSLLGFLGVLSAATSMVIIANVVLSTMLCNDLVVPYLLRHKVIAGDEQYIGKKLLFIRRIMILLISLLAYVYYQFISGNNAIASTGLLSFALIAQFAPAVVLSVYWKQASAKGVLAGIVGGVILWSYTLLLPGLIEAGWVDPAIMQFGPFGLSWLRPTELLGLHGFDQISHGVLWSLSLNLFLLFTISKKSRLTMQEKIQANKFIGHGKELFQVTGEPQYTKMNAKDLMLLCERFLGKEDSKKAFDDFVSRLGQTTINNIEIRKIQAYTEHLLNGALGAASTGMVMDSAFGENQHDFEKVVTLVEEASKAFKFNRKLLQSAVENISHGISVIDSELNLVAWNSKYVTLFNYPEALIKVGRPIADLIRFNLLKDHTSSTELEEKLTRRLNYLKSGKPHVFERNFNDGTVLLIRGNPMPGGGFVTSFIDITKLRTQQKDLEEANENLEFRVLERTAALQNSNVKLEIAKAEAVAANQSKNRFLAAASHDVLQPMTAAKLFTEALATKVTSNTNKELISHLKQSLDSAETLISDLLEISKLETGGVQPQLKTFSLNELVFQLMTELTPLANQSNVELRSAKAPYKIYTDPKFLRRILQNLVVNAIRYSQRNKVLLGCRRQGDWLRIQVFDTGPGISIKDQEKIFIEFTRLGGSNTSNPTGHGLGLAIVDRMANKLGTKVKITSEINRGCCFELSVPFKGKTSNHETDLNSENKIYENSGNNISINKHPENHFIACIDNEPEILKAMRVLLESWGYQVLTATNEQQILNKLKENESIDLLLVDYHLDDEQLGIDSIKNLRKHSNKEIPAVIISANRDEKVKQKALKKGYYWLEKPVKPLALKTLINQLMK